MLKLEERRRGDLIALYKCTSGLDKLDRIDLIMTEERRGLRGHSKKMKNGVYLKTIKRRCFFYRNFDKQNGVRKEIGECRVSQMKGRLKKHKQGDNYPSLALVL